MNDGPNATWLPNLVGGVSIWKLAVDLNEPKFFDGRLLVPETEGSESLPVTVRWDLSNLVPLREARAKHPAEVDAAIKDFQGALERVAKVFATKDSGFDKYKTAFTVPSVDADADDARGNYFYSESTKKLYVINWGASPRSMAGRAEYVFGYEDWGKAFKDKDAALAGGSVSALAAAPVAGSAAAAAAAAAAEAAKKQEQEKKDAEKKDAEKKKEEDGKKRPWWMWPLFALIAIALVLLALFLLKACEEQKNLTADGGEAGAEASVDGATDGAAAGDGASEAGDDAAAAGDATADAASDDAGDGGADAAAADGGDAGKDAGKDSGANDEGDEDDDTDSDIELGPDGKPKPGGKVIITMGGAPGGALPAAKKAPHRRHYQADAVKWRVVSGNDKVTRTETRGKRFDVWLAKGKTFQGVGVEWQDKSGKWHAH
jgi:hypothetical protein